MKPVKNSPKSSLTFLPMVDGVLCAISVLIVFLLIVHTQNKRTTEVPQADIVVRCILPDSPTPSFTNYLLEISTSDRKVVRISARNSQKALRKMVSDWPDLTVRFSVLNSLGKQDNYCVNRTLGILENIHLAITHKNSARGGAVPVIFQKHIEH